MRPKYLITILVLLALAAPASPAHAGGIVSVCDEAHLLAALAGGGTVTFSCSGTITVTAEITIAAVTTIDGSGQTVTISGNHAVRVFTVNSGVTLNLNSLTVANGSTSGDGGGIYNLGTLTVSNSTFSGNSASFGGGVSNLGTVTVSNSTFSGNSASETGGGIMNWDQNRVTVSNSTFSGNSGGGITNMNILTVSNSTFSGNSGGGINSDGSLTVSNSTFSGNTAFYGGGMIIHPRGTVIVSNSTFSGNTADSGGGVYVHGGAGNALAVSNCTFSGNTATYGGGIFNLIISTVTVSNSTISGNSATYGGGIYNENTYGGATLKNTIVANNPAGGNCYGTITDGDGNLSYPDTTCPGIHSDPLLGPLQNNGGPTETMAPGPGSAALDAANDAICAAAPVNSLDQRGIARPQGMHCDIGAVEQIQEPSAVSLTALSAQSLPGTIPPTIIVGLLLAALVGAGIRRRRHMT